MAQTTKKAAPKLKRKLMVLMGMATLIFLLLVFRLFQVQIIDGPELQEKASKQWTRRTSLTAQRGRLLDTSGLVLAQSGTSYRVLLNPQAIDAQERIRVAIEVSDVLGLSYDYVLERVNMVDKQQIQLKRQVESDVVAQLEALQLGGAITFATDQKRYYPFGQLFTQLIGFSGIDGEGQTGIEASYDEYLAGEDGMLVAEVDRKNNTLSYGEEEYIAPTDGYDLQLTADSVTQTYLEKQLAECLTVNNANTATGVIMNPTTGEILAVGSYPSFDLNSPPRDQVTQLMAMSKNRAVSDTFEPGSIFKIITLAAALDSGKVTMDTTFDCDGYKTFRLEKIHCWKTAGHGHQTLQEACANSCNCAFMEMAAMVGVDTLYDYIYAFGFTESTESGIPSEDTGELAHRKYVRDADLARIGFGQSITVTALQMTNAVCAAVNGGILMQPYVISKVTATDGTVIESTQPTQIRRVISSDTSAKIRSLLQSVVDKGSGSNASVLGYTVGGKTGTAQKYEDDGTASRTRLIASFVGFLPTDNPELVCLITVDEPKIPVVYGSTVAAPFVGAVFKDLVQYYGILPDRANEQESAEVPNLLGLSGQDAAVELERKGFVYTMTDTDKTGVVTAQIPAAGTKAPSGSIVLVYTNLTTFSDEGLYKEMVEMPDLLGLRRQEAYDACIRRGLICSFDVLACVGRVDTQSVAAGTMVEPGTNVYLTFVKLDKDGNNINDPNYQKPTDGTTGTTGGTAGGNGTGDGDGDTDTPTLG